jgi:DNA-binding NarL/FixJ family response regulator
VRVLIVDDHAVVRQALAVMLGEQEDIDIVGQAANGRQAIELARTLQPDIVLMDVSMPVMGGVEATRVISTECPAAQVIGLSMFENAEQARPMFDAGARDYVCKTDPPEVLLTAMRRCVAG